MTDQPLQHPGEVTVDWPTCKCGCGEPVPAAPRSRLPRGIVKGQPLAYCYGHIPRKLKAPQTLTVDPETGCHYWTTGHRDRYRYLWRDGKSWPAHRAVWEEVNGPLPEGQVVHHRCEHKGCVNLDHLELMDFGAHTTHHAKGKSRGPKRMLTEAEHEEIVRRVRAGENPRDVAAEFRIAYGTVFNIKTRLAAREKAAA